MKILLISPCSEDDIVNTIVHEIPYMIGKSAQLTPLAVVTVAALTPSAHEVSIHDEHMRGPVEPLLEDNHYDIIGISMLSNQVTRTRAIAEFCKKKKLTATIVLGGPCTSILPPDLKPFIDIVFFGEAEETWPQFLQDFQAGRHKSFYQQISKPNMSKSPIPKWDLIREDLPAYSSGTVQTTRGCPFDCAFCDVIYIYGRRPRSKSINQVIEEIRLLEGMGVKAIFISDDNFAGNKRRAKELLREMIKLNNSFDVPIVFITQADLTIANDEELLRLMADANLVDVLIGIESINQDSLRDLNKLQNIRLDICEAVRKIQSYGMAVLGSMIIGADSDDKSVFKQTADFVSKVNMTDYVSHPLTAPPGTRLWYQLRREGRLVETGPDMVFDIPPNVIPKKMTRSELMEGLADYWEEVFDPLHYMKRAIGFVKGVKRKPRVKQAPLQAFWNHRKVLFKMFWYYLVQTTPDHRKAFFTILRTTLRHAPYMLGQMIFLHVRFMFQHKRYERMAKLARECAAWERSHPDKLQIQERSIPIPSKVRERAGEIFTAAYARVRKEISNCETLYKVVIEAMVDYIDRFGETFEQLDNYHLGYINESCDRIMAHTLLPQPGEPSDLPVEHPPPGFEREMLDGIDHAMRLREYMAA